MDKIILQDLMVDGILGVNPDERQRQQPIRVNLTLWVDTRRPAVSDRLEDTVNYAAVAQRVRQRITDGGDQLVEKLAHDLARLILTDFEGVARVMVRVEKPTALAQVGSVGVEIKRSRHDFNL